MGKSADILTTDPPASTTFGTERAGTATDTRAAFAEILADLVDVERVPVDSHFFDDLGADSMVMARFCARVRKRADLPSVSMKDIYQHPTIARLSTALAPVLETPAATEPPAQPETPASPEPPATHSTARASRLEYVVCGALQLLIFLCYATVVGLVATLGFEWISAGVGPVDAYLRAVAFGGATFVAVSALPILAKWALIGRWKPREIRIWSLTYVRFWLVKTLVRSNPLALLFVGTPVYSLYLRALGAKVGRGSVILSRNVPVCADLFSIGAGSVICKDAFFLGYQAHDGLLRTGAVTLGSGVFVGEKSVLDIGTSMGDQAQLGHASALQSGQSVPAGQRWHGCPAERTDLDYARVPQARATTLRQVVYCVVAALQVLFVFLPLAEGGVFAVLSQVPSLARLLEPGLSAFNSWQMYLDALSLSTALFFGGLVAGLFIVFIIPRCLNLFIEPGKIYPLYGFHHSAQKMITVLTNRKFFTYLFGDSSYIVHYLRCLGYNLSRVVQTGSNFGMEVLHDNPYLTSIGSGTMVADGLSVVNAEFSSTSFRVSPVEIGPNNFLGNHIVYPPGGRTGDNCLLATKVMIPLDGEIREGVGLLGSPCFAIPRSVARDSRFDDLATGEEFQRRLARKNRYDIRTMGVFLFGRWLHVLLLTVIGMLAIDLYGIFGHLLTAALFSVSVLSTPIYFILVERVFTAFRPLRPRYCSIYDPYFWWHERLWKTPADTYLRLFDGTPFKSVIWRSLGVRIGKQVFDDGCYLTERTLVTIGDGCTLNTGTKIQCHSQEDGTFKSDRITIGAGVTLGVSAMVHYGITMGDGSSLAADSFLMKGEEIPPHAHWGGNPAKEIRRDHYQPA